VFTDNDAPSKIIATFNIFLDVNLRAGFIHAGWKKLFIIVPINKAIIDAPSRPPGIKFSKRTDTPATAKHITMPRAKSHLSFALVFIVCLL
jgi:hypothetical protein